MKWICFKKLECIASGENEKSMPLCHVTEKAEIDILFLLHIDSSNSKTRDPSPYLTFSWSFERRELESLG